MALLKSIDNVPGIDYYDYRDDQYYNKYEYRMRVSIPCVKYTWYCKDEKALDDKLNNPKKSYLGVRKEDRDKVIENLPALKAIVTLQQERKKSKDLGIRIEATTIAFFSNDLSKLKGLENVIGNNYSYDYTQVQTAEYAGVKYFVGEPKHKYRVYLKSRRIKTEFPSELRDLFKRNKSLYPSPALVTWINRNQSWQWRWASSSHFIDYDDESTLSYLALMHGEMLGKKYKLEKRPEAI